MISACINLSYVYCDNEPLLIYLRILSLKVNRFSYGGIFLPDGTVFAVRAVGAHPIVFFYFLILLLLYSYVLLININTIDIIDIINMKNKYIQITYI